MKVGDLVRVLEGYPVEYPDGQLGVIVGPANFNRQWKVKLTDGELFRLYDFELEAINESR